MMTVATTTTLTKKLCVVSFVIVVKGRERREELNRLLNGHALWPAHP